MQDPSVLPIQLLKGHVFLRFIDGISKLMRNDTGYLATGCCCSWIGCWCTIGSTESLQLEERMRSRPEGMAVLLERPRVISSNVEHAWDLPPNTVGAAYAKFMGSRNFSPDDMPPVRFMETEEIAYIATHAREIHDFWHTLFGLPTDLIGESALKVIEFEQMLLPMCALSVVGGTSRFNEKQRKLFYQHYFPWALRAGMRCDDLMCTYYERHFDEDLEDVQWKWGIVPAPPPQLRGA